MEMPKFDETFFAGLGLTPPDVHSFLQPVTHAGLGLLTKTTRMEQSTLTLDVVC